MKTKALLYAAVIAAVSLSCTREVVESGQMNPGTELRFTAEWASENGGISRTVLREDGKSVWWMPGDEINLFFGDKASGKFVSDNEDPAAVVDFVGTLPIAIGSMEMESAGLACWAAYPYDEANGCDGQSITMSLPYIQEGKANGFADKFFPSVAKSNNFLLPFWNVCGGARFSVTQEGVTKVIFKSNDGSPIAGKVKVGFGNDNKPQILEFTNPVDSVVVKAPEGGFVPGTNYFAAMLPQSHVKGMTITLSTQDKKATRTLPNAVTVHRSLFGVLDNVDEGLEYHQHYLVPEAVDLGLSVKWASFNLGATKPEEYGDYFAWGETEPKEEYTWVNYKFRASGDSDSNVKFSKYNTMSLYGPVDNKTVLDVEEDAAAFYLGGSWRMPTRRECVELFDNCTQTKTTFNGVSGKKLTSKKEGYKNRWIFLPAAGYLKGTSLREVSSRGYWMSSSLDMDSPSNAHSGYFGSDFIGCGGGSRYYGMTVRPVCE